jgi:hypothetical protein
VGGTAIELTKIPAMQARAKHLAEGETKTLPDFEAGIAPFESSTCHFRRRCADYHSTLSIELRSAEMFVEKVRYPSDFNTERVDIVHPYRS